MPKRSLLDDVLRAEPSKKQAPAEVSSDVAKIGWVQELYPELAPAMAGAWEILRQADDAALVRAMRESETHGLEAVEGKTARTLRARLLSEKDCDGLYSHRIGHLFRMAHTLAPAQAVPLIRAAIATACSPTCVLVLAFEHVFGAAEADEVVSTLLLPMCRSEYEAYGVGEALAASLASTDAIARRAASVFEPASVIDLAAVPATYALFACASALVLRDAPRYLPRVRAMSETTSSAYVKRCLEDIVARSE